MLIEFSLAWVAKKTWRMLDVGIASDSYSGRLLDKAKVIEFARRKRRQLLIDDEAHAAVKLARASL